MWRGGQWSAHSIIFISSRGEYYANQKIVVYAERPTWVWRRQLKLLLELLMCVILNFSSLIGGCKASKRGMLWNGWMTDQIDSSFFIDNKHSLLYLACPSKLTSWFKLPFKGSSLRKSLCYWRSALLTPPKMTLLLAGLAFQMWGSIRMMSSLLNREKSPGKFEFEWCKTVRQWIREWIMGKLTDSGRCQRTTGLFCYK